MKAVLERKPKLSKMTIGGFTLVELLAVIVILAIILIIAIPGVLSIINKTKNSAYDRQVDMIKEATRNYITANPVTWNGDNPKRTLVTLDMLQTSGYLDKKLLDPRDKKEILCANVLVTKNNKNKISYDVDMTCNDVQPINPRLGSGMIPIVYNGSTWVKADASNQNFAWFNYGDRQWANVATVTEDVRQALMEAPIGTVVPMEKINTMFVWIPRFKYKLFNVDGTVSPVGNKNLAGDYLIDIKFETVSTTKSTGTQNAQWLTHPAFTLGGQELEGFWMAKFETGYLGAASPSEASQNIIDSSKIMIRPNVYSWRGIQVSNMYKNAQGMKVTNNVFGLTTTEDPHMMKNIEWGAMAYLSYSRYGKQGNNNYSNNDKHIQINTYQDGMTGCGGKKNPTSISFVCDSYETENGLAASTTGNITGIYDTAGGLTEYVTAVQRQDSGDLQPGKSGFDQIELNQYGQDEKYFDIYPTKGNYVDYTGGKLGDATIEMGPFANNRNSWYNGFAYALAGTGSWAIRGASWSDFSTAGPSAFSCSDAAPFSNSGYRIIVV